MKKKSLATVWLDGCSGCHMSFLDLDERLLEVAALADVVYSPLVDVKEFPTDVDVTLVEGAVSSEADLAKIHHIRQHTRLLVSLGDCAVTTNVPGMRNPFGKDAVLQRGYVDTADLNPGIPLQVVPALLPRVLPVHAVVKVDAFIPGCPPSADTIYFALTELLEGRIPDVTSRTHFGA